MQRISSKNWGSDVYDLTFPHPAARYLTRRSAMPKAALDACRLRHRSLFLA
ncbi:hypothetical protein [Nostoc sp. 'Peltigera membranacea cyanobiont' 210A]|uniref:hypothetical protein n=1 Tax=Nostoc sp. 'Peltigera membranacea cyanobiont' 210A TaxID=2014529 RepID=UPI00167D4FE8|nr:hypothetical protein [Nostoc sp. 'Peltigera membranacea cyanobiont' 210A]